MRLNIIVGLGRRGFLRFLSDKTYLKLAYKSKTGFALNLDEPKGYFDKINWLKLHYRNQEMKTIVDKVAFKEFVSKKVGDKFVVPTIKVYDSYKDINLDELPNEFVMKCSHDSHSVFICKDKTKINITVLKKKMKKCMTKNLFWYSREWPYKELKPRILVEKLLPLDEKQNALLDYKWFCFNGESKFMYIGFDAGKNPYSDFYDMEFHQINVRSRDPKSNIERTKPKEFEEMRKIANILSQGFPHVRVDFYVSNGAIYVGEMTFFHCGGLGRFSPESFEDEFGRYINIEGN